MAWFDRETIRRKGIRLPRLLDVLGFGVVMAAALCLPLVDTTPIPFAFGLIVGALALWIVAWLTGSREGAQPWALSAKVACVMLAVGQVSTVAMFRRTQRVTDQRIAAERDSSEDRESRKTARREQVAREEAREESLSAQKRREAELAEIRQRVAGLDSEIAYRLAVWRDSLDAIGSLVPQALRREAGFYERTENACRRFLGPRRTLVADLRMNTTYQIISERQGKDPQRDVERAMTYLIAITVDPNARSFVGVSHSWTNPDTLIVQMRPLFSENMERVPLSAVVEAISLPRWRKQLDKQ